MSRKIFRTSFKLSLVIFILLSIIFVTANAIVVGSSAKHIYSIEEVGNLEKAHCVLVLGARVYSEERLSPVLQDRVDFAISIYNSGKAEKLLLSGDHGQDEYDEVNAMMNYAVSKGIPKEDIFLDHAGFSTYESIYRARDIFCVTDVIIVTQKFHLFRAVYTAKNFGLKAQGVNSNPRKYLYEDYDAARESLARVKDFFYVGLLKPEPTYLGEQIPITGDSALTYDK